MIIGLFPDALSVVVATDGRGTSFRLPTTGELQEAGVSVPEDIWEFFRYGEDSVGGLLLDPGAAAHLPLKGGNGAGAGDASDRSSLHLEVVRRRDAVSHMDTDDFWAMNRTFHLAHWDRHTRFCGACAAAMERSSSEISKRCPSCGAVSYPHIAPAVIVAIVKEGKLLLAHNAQRPTNMYSVLAGFVEPGESLEHAVSREVFEESGITVRNIEYFSSQPWPFPGSLMIAFTAEYAAGTVVPDREEIDEIGWFAPGELPEELPGSLSVARRLIEWFVSEYGTDDDLRALCARL